MVGSFIEFDTVPEPCQHERRRIVLATLLDEHQNDERRLANLTAKFNAGDTYLSAIPDVDSTLATPRES